MDLMHINSTKAGYVDLDGCTITDMLPRYDAQLSSARHVNKKSG